MRIDLEGNKAHLKWNPTFIEAVLEHIMQLTEKDRVHQQPGEWFFYLGGYKIDKREKDPTHEDCLYGWFESVRIGFTTNLRRLSTMDIRPNPKEKDESEIHKTFFYFRLKDGLLLLDTYFDNIVTHRRIESYLASKAEDVFQKFKIKYITFHNLISKGFLEKLRNFEVIRLAQIRLNVQSETPYDTQDAIGSLQEISRSTNANYLDITMGRSHARKHGLLVRELKKALELIMRDRRQVISGTVEGTRNDGGPPTIKLKGIEEKFKKQFGVDGYGEVLSEPMFAYMIDIGNKHD